MKLRVLLAIVLVGLAAAGGAFYWHIGTMLIAREPRQALAAPGDLPVERVMLNHAGAPELVGWVANRKGSCGAIVLLHGRGANRLALVQRANLLFDAGYSVVLFDLSGHGESGGSVQGFGYSESQDAVRGNVFPVIGLALLARRWARLPSSLQHSKRLPMPMCWSSFTPVCARQRHGACLSISGAGSRPMCFWHRCRFVSG